MKTSESIAKISAAMTKAWGELNNPKHNKIVTVKMKNGGKYKFEYTDLGGVIDEVKPHFKKYEISIMQHAYTEFTDNRTLISVDTQLLHSSGEWFKSRPLQILASQNIQDMGGQITYMKRYSLSAMLGVSAEEDDDSNGSVGNQADFEQHEQPEKQVDKGVIQAKFMSGGGTEEQFQEWYKKQVAAKFEHNQMDAYLTKKMMEKK